MQKTLQGNIPHSINYSIFVENIVKGRCSQSKMLNTLAEQGKLPEINKKIMLSILAKSMREVRQILNAMQMMVKEL